MKNFEYYLTESKKTYVFKLRVAGEIPETFENKLERSLNKFEVVKLTKGKTTPISEKPLDFPQLQNCEVTHWEIELNYPTTSHMLEKYIVDECSVPHQNLIVRGENDPVEEYQPDDQKEKPYETLLTKEELDSESGQDHVGGKRVMDLLKELESARKERDIDPISEIKAGDTKKDTAKENVKSPIGS